MKQIQVEAITPLETIKPSTPTPHTLRRHNLSFFDQVEPPRYMNAILYFSSQPSNTTRSNVSNALKTSLAQILSIYYPLAGRVADDNLYVECHDQGSHYREANVKGSLTSEIMSDLDPSELSKFLSYDTVDVISTGGGGRPPLLVVQVNFFECGRVVIGILMYHKVGDALSLFTFLNNWASVARNEQRRHFILPDFSSASKLFPSVDLNGWQPAMNNGVTKEERVSRRFVFSNDTILGLCKTYSTSQQHDEVVERRPSRIEALSVFIWKRYIAATQRVQPRKNYSVVLAVNLRTRFDPPLQPSVFGNLADVAVAMDTSPNQDNHSKLVQSLRTSLLNLSDPEHTKLYRNGVQLLPMIKETYDGIYSENEVWICFTSVCKFPIRDADFGWGRASAMHVDLPKMYGKNMVVFMDSSDDGDGVEAWISFNKEDMDKFEVDPELLAHATWPC